MSAGLFSKIHLFGAPGSGVSTLGRSLAQALGYPFFDTDDYYWFTEDALPYRRKRNPEHRLRLLRDDLDKTERYVVAGALLGWGEALVSRFDVLIYRWLPADIRLQRIRQREVERYGAKRLQPGGDLHVVFVKFLEWADRYDSGDAIRSQAYERAWLERQKKPTLYLEEDLSAEQLLTVVTAYLRWGCV